MIFDLAAWFAGIIQFFLAILCALCTVDEFKVGRASDGFFLAVLTAIFWVSGWAIFRGLAA